MKPVGSTGTDLRGFPLVQEYRLFYFRKKILAYPEAEGVDAVLRQVERWNELARKFESTFISIDVAQLESGDWTVIEVGDGGVSGLPLSIDPVRFYNSLFAANVSE